jgi:hypothetical protein
MRVRQQCFLATVFLTWGACCGYTLIVLLLGVQVWSDPQLVCAVPQPEGSSSGSQLQHPAHEPGPLPGEGVLAQGGGVELGVNSHYQPMFVGCINLYKQFRQCGQQLLEEQ